MMRRSAKMWARQDDILLGGLWSTRSAKNSRSRQARSTLQSHTALRTAGRRLPSTLDRLGWMHSVRRTTITATVDDDKYMQRCSNEGREAVE